jgi:hypothetical protein
VGTLPLDDRGGKNIYIFDHNSTVPLINVLYPMVNSGNISYSYFK